MKPYYIITILGGEGRLSNKNKFRTRDEAVQAAEESIRSRFDKGEKEPSPCYILRVEAVVEVETPVSPKVLVTYSNKFDATPEPTLVGDDEC